MRYRSTLLVAVLVAGCATSPRGSGDAELAQRLQQQWVAAIPEPSARAGLFAPDARVAIRGIRGPDGAAARIDLAGIEQIRPFVMQTPTPPGFAMEFLSFEREGSHLTQTGRWSMRGDGGTFTLTWRRAEGGQWRVVLWSMIGSAGSPGGKPAAEAEAS